MPLSSSSKTQVSAFSAWQSKASSSARPRPMNSALSGLSFFCRKRPTTSAPAVSARRASSSRDSSLSMPISTTRSRWGRTASSARAMASIAASASSTWRSQASSGRRYQRAGSVTSGSSSPCRKAACTQVGSPSLQPTAIIAS